jgi:WD40 repeat protein
VRCLTYARDGSALVTGSHDSTVKVWNPRQSSGAEVIAAHKSWVQCLALGSKNRVLVSGARNGTLKLWDPIKGQLLLELPTLSGAVTSVALSSHTDKLLLAAATRDEKEQGEIKVWELVGDAKQAWKAKDLHTLRGHTKGVNALAFNPGLGKADLLVSGGADGSVILWDAAAGKEKIAYRQTHKDEVRCVTFAPDGNLIASGGKDRAACLYATERKQHFTLTELHLGAIETLTLLYMLAEENTLRLTLVTGSADQTVRNWMLQEQGGKIDVERENPLTLRSHVQPVTSLVSNKNLLATSSLDGAIKLYNVPFECCTLLGHQGPVRALALASDQSFLVSAGHDGTLRIWRAPEVP